MKTLTLVTFIITSFIISLQAQTTKRPLELPEFNKIYVNSNYTVYVKQTNKQEVSVEALSEIYSISEIKVEDGILLVNIDRKPESTNKSIWAKIDDIKLNPTINLYVSVRNIDELQVNGGGKIISENSIATDNIILGVSGSGSMNVDLKGDMVHAEVSGPGSMTLKGYANTLEAKLSGSGNMNAFDCALTKASVRVSGAGTADLNVTDSMDAVVHGTGSVRHKGNTKNVTGKTYGSGTIVRAY